MHSTGMRGPSGPLIPVSEREQTDVRLRSVLVVAALAGAALLPSEVSTSAVRAGAAAVT
jgi:hypothetical protein